MLMQRMYGFKRQFIGYLTVVKRLFIGIFIYIFEVTIVFFTVFTTVIMEEELFERVMYYYLQFTFAMSHDYTFHLLLS